MASIAPHLFKKLAERAKETFGGTSVPETVLAPRHDAPTRFQPKSIQKGKGLVLKVASSTSEVADETTGPVLKIASSTSEVADEPTGPVLKVASSTSEVADETPVHGKVDLVLKLKGNAVKEFVSKDSELKYTKAISAAQYMQRQFELGSIVQLVVITITMVVCCIRAAKCCRAIMMHVKAMEDHVDNAKGKAWKCAQKKSPKSSAARFLSSEKELKVSLDAHEAFSETYKKQKDKSTHGLIGSLAWASIDSDKTMKEDEHNPVLLMSMGSTDEIPCVSSLIGSSAWASIHSDEGMKDDDYQSVSLGTESIDGIPYVPSLVTEGERENECFDQQATSLVSTFVKVNPGGQDSSDRKQEEQGTLDTLGVSRQVTVDEGAKEGSDATPVSLVTISAVEVSPPSLWRDSSPGREQNEITSIDTVDASSQINLDDYGEKEEKNEDFESKTLHLVMRGARQEQPPFVMTDWSPRPPDGKGPVEVSDPEQIISGSKSASETTHKSLLRDCPSLASATSLDSSITSDGEMTNCRGGSSIASGGGSTISPGSPGRSVKRISFCPSPPQVREYERYDMDREDPSSATSGNPVQYNNLNQKLRMLKKNLDELNGDGEASDVPDHATQIVSRVAKQLGQVFLMVSASVLTQRR